VWFKIHHPERLQSAVDRYTNEIRRVAGVLDYIKKGREYLVGGRFNYADFGFVSWSVPWVAGDVVDLKQFYSLHAWSGRLKARPAVVAGLGRSSDAPKML
jgi:glutathione S-transferase